MNHSKYEIGDIVFVSMYNYEGGEEGKNHLFVIIGDNSQLVPIEYFGMIVSSHREKGKDVSEFSFNEPLSKNTDNNLHKDSIVKCDQIYQIPIKNIQFKIGQVDIDDYMRFMDAYERFLNTISDNSQEV